MNVITTPTVLAVSVSIVFVSIRPTWWQKRDKTTSKPVISTLGGILNIAAAGIFVRPKLRTYRTEHRNAWNAVAFEIAINDLILATTS